MTEVSRETLYDQVWERPMTAVAKDYGVSSNFLGRVCEELNVPRPARGYWARKRAGQKMKKDPLPMPEPGDDSHWLQGQGTRGEEEAVYCPPDGTRLREKMKRHRALAGAKVGFLKSERRRFSDDGYLKPKARLLPDLLVSERILPRALKVVQALFTALEDAGFWVRIAAPGFTGQDGSLNPRVDGAKPRDGSFWRAREHWQPVRPTLVYVGGVPIGLTLFEQLEKLPTMYDDGAHRQATKREVSYFQRIGQAWRVSERYMQNGQLGLRAYSPFDDTAWENNWREKAGERLEGCVSSIVEALGKAAPLVAQLEQERREKRAQEQMRLEQERQERRRAARKQAESDSVAASQEQLLSLIDSWGNSRRIEEFLTNLEREVQAMPEGQRGELGERVAAARRSLVVPSALEYLKDWQSPDEHFQKIWSERERRVW